MCVSVPPYRSGVAGPAYEDLRGPIPSRGHIVRDGHDGVVVAGLVYAGKTEVCKLQQTVRVHKDVPGPISIGIGGKYACMYVCSCGSHEYFYSSQYYQGGLTSMCTHNLNR